MRLRNKPEHVLLLLGAYAPALFSLRGRVAADSKQYLYLDPGRFLARASDLWDPAVGAGTVPHQHLGYLFPMGPWFWVFDQLGVPDWLAQRLWLGTLSAAAALGARWLFTQVGIGRLGALAGASVYLLTPYQLAFSNRLSALLLPWAALPWLVGLTMRTTRTRDWGAPAALSLVLLVAGGVNASSLVLVLLAPALWLLLELGRGRRAGVLVAAGRIALLGAGVCLWWVVGIVIAGRYGLPVLQLTENLPTIAAASSPGEILRGLGNWFFFIPGEDGLALRSAEKYASDSLIVALSLAVPVLGLAVGALVRWTHRSYFALLVVIGTVIGVGSWPYEDRSAYGSAWRWLTMNTSAGLAFRNSPRVVPIVALGLAGLLGAAVSAITWPRWRQLGGSVVIVLAVGAFLPALEHGLPGEDIDRPETVPDYWTDAVAALDAGDHGTRILEVPGASFAAYEWGTTVDPLTPGLTDRPYLAREVLPLGSRGTVNLLDALDRRMQLGTFEPRSLVPMARLLGVGTVVLRADLEQSGRFDTPPPAPLWDALTSPPPTGIADPVPFGPRTGAVPKVSLFEVEDPLPIVRLSPVDAPIVLAGDGDGVVDAAAAGLLAGDPLVLYGASLDDHALDEALDRRARLVVTDSNRRRIQTWYYGLRDTRGPTEEVGATAPDPTGYDVRLELFPGSGDDSRTVVEQAGGSVHATHEGGPLRPEDRAAHAVDGDPSTAWRVGGADPRGATLTLVPPAPVTASSVTLRQAGGDRRLARVGVTVNGAPPIEVELGPESAEGAGQVVPFPAQEVRELLVDVLATTPAGPAQGEVGIAEVGLGAVRIEEMVRPPVDLLSRVGAAAAEHPLDIVLTRLRVDLPGTNRSDDETRLLRRIELPAGRSFALRGTWRGSSQDLPGGCTTGLVTIDGAPVPVRVEAGPEGADGHDLVGCAEVDLPAGSHRIEALAGAPGSVDRLVLSTTDQTPAMPPPVGSTVAVEGESATEIDLAVTTDGEPFWLVLGQSLSDGWRPSVTGASVGPLQLVNGYANGWLVTPDAAGSLAISLRWTPQRFVWVGAAISLIVVALCLWLVVRGRRVGATVDPPLAQHPALRGWERGRRRLGVVPGLLAAAGSGAAAALVAPPKVAVATAAAALVASWAPTGAWLVALAGPLALGLSRVGPRPWMAWLAVSLLAVDLVVSAWRPSVPRAQPGEE